MRLLPCGGGGNDSGCGANPPASRAGLLKCSATSSGSASWAFPARAGGSVPVHYELGDNHVVWITIDRPHAMNSLDMDHFAQLRRSWDRFGEDEEAWVAIITGVGNAFCTGADLKTYIPEITKLQKQIATSEVTEIDGYRID